MTAGTRVDRQRIDATLKTVGLDEVGSKPVKKYSQGLRQRLGLARAILLEPQLLILDEPANGLDPAGIVWLREFLGHVASRGTTIVVSSHQLGEIEKVCDRVAIMNEGRLVEVGTVGDVGGGGQQARIQLRPEDVEVATPILRKAQASSLEDGIYVVRDVTARDISQALAGCGVFPISVTDKQLNRAGFPGGSNS
jgi:ABC-2 type transport system ATP-binding protein